jgi:NTE family protein
MARARSTKSAEAANTTVLVLQGGGALGAYQAGAFEAMATDARQPGWVAGISIGAINAALIAGNAPEHRVERLKAFWERVTAAVPGSPWSSPNDLVRSWINDWSAAWSASFGLPGFFRPRLGTGALFGAAENPSIYDTGPLRDTLLELVDFDRLNDGPTRLSVGAVDVQSGNFAYFDNRHGRIRPEHVMASGALPPGFPAISIDGRMYWDGGIVSNTPLRHVVENLSVAEATIFQVDLFSARGQLPGTLAQVAEREKDIRFSSRTRAVTDVLRERHEMHRRIRALAAMLPAYRRADSSVQELLADTNDTAITLVHLIHRSKGYETQSKDYEFSRASMLEHWSAGRSDMRHSLRALSSAPEATHPNAFRVFDFNPDPTRGTPS